MFVQYGIERTNWRLIDGLVSLLNSTAIICSAAYLFLITHRNLFGPFENLNLLNCLLVMQLFGRISVMMTFIEIISVWYITEII